MRITYLTVALVALMFAVLPIPWLAASARAGDLRVLSANVFTGILDELARDFERTTQQTVVLDYGTAGVIRTRVQGGEAGDLTILPRPMLDDCVRQGKVIAGTSSDIARSAVGVAVRTGAPKPDISSVPAVIRALQAATSISYPNPTRGGATGVLFTRVLDRLGLFAAMQPKTKYPPPGKLAVDLVANGEAELAIAQPMEVLAQPGVELVGLLPPDLQDPPQFVFSAGIMATTKQQDAAVAFVRFLSGPAAASIFRAKGMNPG